MTLTMFTLNAFYGLALAMNMFIIASGLNLIFGVLRVLNYNGRGRAFIEQ